MLNKCTFNVTMSSLCNIQVSETAESLLWENGKCPVLIRYSDSHVYVYHSYLLHLLGSEQNSALLSLTRWNKPALHCPAGSDIHTSSSLQPAVVRFYLHGNDPVARAGVKGYFLWRESGPWTPVFCCCFLGVCFWLIYMSRPFLDPCSPTASRTRLLHSSI